LTYEQWPQTRMLRGEHLAGSPHGDILVHGMNGREIYVSIAGRPVYDAAGNIVSAIAVLRDVTERHQMEEERQQLDYLKDTFIHIASHELRAPLTPLILSAQLLQHQIAKGAEPALLHQRGQEIVHHAKRMSRMVGEMLNMTRISEGRLTIAPSLADLAQMAREVVAEYCTISGRAIQLTGAEAPVLARCDADRIRQVLTNLLTNALKYASAPAEIAVSISAGADTGPRIAVRDTGPGIAPEVQEHLFERFYRGTQQQEGLGLGLYIAQAIMQEHGGRLRVASAIGQGSTFVMELPLICPNS
jgi:signal transduction histidine kinase